MNRSHGFALVLTIASLGCMRDEADVQQEQERERRELAQDQARERQVLANEQSAELGNAREEAREDLGDRAEQARDERQDSNEANRDLAATIALACTGVANPDSCPIDDAVLRSVADGERGVRVTLGDEAGTREQVQRRIDCYRARVSLRGAPATPCFVDLADENVTVEANEVNGRVVVSLDSTDGTLITRLRERVSAFMTSANSRRAGNLRN